MQIKSKLLPGVYTDSMSLMALSTKVNQLPGVEKAMIGMGTDMNKQVINDVGLMTPELEAATPADMMYVVQCDSEERCDEVLAEIDKMRTERSDEQASSVRFSSTQQAVESDNSDLVVISVPGEYAAGEARMALEHGKNVMIFSDNVSIEDEISLKQYAHEHGLLVMGPDCGTAIINNVGLCFANAVNQGPVGVVAASGTGSQEISVQIDALGSGISQLVGVGGRDLSEEVGGIMMIDGLNMLAEDDATKVIVLLSKPPADAIAEKVLAQARAINKPVVVCFIGSDNRVAEANLTITHSTTEAARQAVSLEGAEVPPVRPLEVNLITPFAEGQRFVRGVFCGGTICDEVFYVLKPRLGNVFSNVAKNQSDILPVGQKSHDNSLIDMGSDEFTQGRAHPMIDPSLRNARLVEEASDPETAVILLDFVLGYGSNEDPVGAAKESIKQAFKIANEAGRHLEIVAYVLGTDRDSQGKVAQVALLEQLGVRVVSNVTQLGEIALELLKK